MSVSFRLIKAGDVDWIVDRHAAVYALEQPGLAMGDFAGTSFDQVVLGIAAHFRDHHDPAGEAGWMAMVGGDRAGCVYCVRRMPAMAQLRLLLVDPRYRGQGIGDALVAKCVAFARIAGYDAITLLTNESQTAARRLYERRGFAFCHRDESPGPPGQVWMTARLAIA